MLEPTKRLEERILLALRAGPLPLRRFGNVVAKRALIALKRQGLVRTRYHSEPSVVLTAAGRVEAERIFAQRATNRRKLQRTSD